MARFAVKGNGVSQKSAIFPMSSDFLLLSQLFSKIKCLDAVAAIFCKDEMFGSLRSQLNVNVHTKRRKKTRHLSLLKLKDSTLSIKRRFK